MPRQERQQQMNDSYQHSTPYASPISMRLISLSSQILTQLHIMSHSCP